MIVSLGEGDEDDLQVLLHACHVYLPHAQLTSGENMKMNKSILILGASSLFMLQFNRKGCSTLSKIGWSPDPSSGILLSPYKD